MVILIKLFKYNYYQIFIYIIQKRKMELFKILFKISLIISYKLKLEIVKQEKNYKKSFYNNFKNVKFV